MMDKKELNKEEMDSVSGGVIKPNDTISAPEKPTDTAVWIGGSDDPNGSK